MTGSMLERSAKGKNVERVLQNPKPSNEYPFRQKFHGSEAPILVHEVLRNQGEPLDAATRQTMEPRFGHDFSDVQIYNNPFASLSTHAIDAAAFTIGNRIVFREGYFAPHTASGQRLLAHELAHVQQQSKTKSTIPSSLTIGTTSNALETEAQQASELVNSSPSTPISIQETATPQISRSLLGGLVGGVLGAVAGAGLGFLVGGPVGAVVGGLGGLVAGAAIGNAASTRERHLEADKEIPYAHEIFQDSLNYSKITITRDSMMSVGAPRTIGNTIHLRSDWGHFEGDTMELTNRGLITLVHEMGHVWQYQHAGLGYIPKSLIAQLNAWISTGDRNSAYDWRKQHQAGVPWEKWNPEQQAEAIETYNASLRSSNDGTASADDFQNLAILLPYIEKVRRGEGAA